MADTDTEVAQQCKDLGTYSTGNYEEEPCPNCGVVQEMEVLVSEWETPDGNVRESYHVDRHCPVCSHHIEVLPA